MAFFREPYPEPDMVGLCWEAAARRSDCCSQKANVEGVPVNDAKTTCIQATPFAPGQWPAAQERIAIRVPANNALLQVAKRKELTRRDRLDRDLHSRATCPGIMRNAMTVKVP